MKRYTKFAEVNVYIGDGGQIFTYTIRARSKQELGSKAREHLHTIATGGYRHNDGKGELTWYPPKWIYKIKIVGDIPTNYADRCGGT